MAKLLAGSEISHKVYRGEHSDTRWRQAFSVKHVPLREARNAQSPADAHTRLCPYALGAAT